MAEAKIAAFEKAESEAKEAGRLSLVSKATEMGLAGVDEFSSEMLERVIASWEASRPAPKEMIPATPAAQKQSVEATEAPRKRLSQTISTESVSNPTRRFTVWHGTLGHLLGTATFPALIAATDLLPQCLMKLRR